MMTGTLLAAKLLSAGCQISICVVLWWLAVIDIRTHTVSNRAIVVSAVVLAVIDTILFFSPGGGWYFGASRLFSALLGGTILLLIAMITRGGIGGGDIKLMAAIGLSIGYIGTLFVLFVASVAALIQQLIRKHKGKGTAVAFVPGMAAGYTLLTALSICALLF